MTEYRAALINAIFLYIARHIGFVKVSFPYICNYKLIYVLYHKYILRYQYFLKIFATDITYKYQCNMFYWLTSRNLPSWCIILPPIVLTRLTTSLMSDWNVRNIVCPSCSIAHVKPSVCCVDTSTINWIYYMLVYRPKVQSDLLYLSFLSSTVTGTANNKWHTRINWYKCLHTFLGAHNWLIITSLLLLAIWLYVHFGDAMMLYINVLLIWFMTAVVATVDKSNNKSCMWKKMLA